MNIRLIVFLLFVSGGLLLLAACGGGSGAGDPAQTVEQYLQAKADGDADTIRALLCADMEQFLERESRTFDSVSGVHIDGMACTRDGSSDVVRCEGKIVATYGTEDTEFPLTSYRVVQEDGEWKWCGEAG
ncbi:MAG: hypothetical protein IPG51_04825 [Chloroflexi bacterium]|nr:hypothetical protein [Chloroflexota bacterium]